MSGFDFYYVILIPVAALLLSVFFGVVRPRMKRQQKLHGRIAIALPANDDHMPARPPRPATPEQIRHVIASMPAEVLPQAHSVPSPQVATAAQIAAAQHLQVATGTHGVIPVEARAATDTPHLRLESALSDTLPPRAEGRSTARRLSRIPEGTLQFLPGRLEIVEGRDVGQEVRFVRQPGDEETTITFGRSDGPQYRHVQLHEPTVSRLHAKMTLEGRKWRVINLSQTNPIVVNGVPLEGEGSSHTFADGDRVEMGEVIFRFVGK